MATGDYTKTAWVHAATVGTALRMNNLETQFEEAAYIPGAKMLVPVVRWVMPGWWVGTSVNQAMTANRTYYTPIYVPELTTYDRIGINVTVGDGGAGLCDLRVFHWTAGVPGALVLSCGTVSTNAAAAVEIDTSATVIGTTGLNGLYFLGARFDNTPTVVGAGATGTSPPASASALTNLAAGISNIIPYDDAAYADPAGATDGLVLAAYAVVRLRES